MCCFVIEHRAAYRADKKRKALIPCCNQLRGKLFLYEWHIVKATGVFGEQSGGRGYGARRGRHPEIAQERPAPW
jgi:hypothetical protein